HEDLEPEIEVTPCLADEPRLAPEPSHQVPRHRFRVIDREEWVRDGSREPAARPLVHQPVTAEGLPCELDVGGLLVGLEEDRLSGRDEFGRAREGPSQALPRAVLPAPETSLVLGQCSTPGLGHRPPRPDRRGLRPHDELSRLLDQHGDAQGSRVAPPLEGLELVELEGGIPGELTPQVQVQAAEMAGDLSELELGAPEREMQVSRALPESEPRGDGPKELRVEVGAVVAVVHAEGLTRKGVATSAASKARDGMRPAPWQVVAVADEGFGPGLEVIGAGAIGATRRLEHGKRPPCRP